ncbi:hypothetical protein QBC47DRAFT_373811 [Echria macrotheca]|uniref:Nephrocystin 3-like N-terminal domain-containing protein n=1 Tax=Echria macrotheca TaxID=438768 RepID=A0AAJ0BJ50_9PEZI|nr:hypothetical protein QBC47DRAFT_373811 [Echria macrotheca]
MADPFTAIGTTAAVIDLTKLAWKIVSTAYSCYASGAQASAEDESLEDVIRALRQILDANIGMEMPVRLNDMESTENIDKLRCRCRVIGQEILEILHKSKVGKANSLRAAIKVSLKSIWTEEKIAKLRSELDSITAQLTVHLQVIARTETGRKLDLVLKTAKREEEEVRHQRQLLDSLRLGQGVCLDTLGDLHRLFILPVDESKQKAILDALKFDGMDSRFGSVFSDIQDTFQWSLESQQPGPSSRDDNPADSDSVTLRDWLATGSGVFHISGKMGSGKSTLMKYIVQEPETQRLLDTWAGPERSLVMATFFFCKPGSPLQRNLEGLFRSLLHAVLSQVPDLISIIFPQHWQHSPTPQPWQTVPEIVLRSCEIKEAFHRLTERKSGESGMLKKHCFCFFIDGLDEFHNPEQMLTHRQLANMLLSWTRENPENIKICASSREWEPFMQVFEPKLRLRLHLLTAGDMRQTVVSLLEQHDRFTAWPERERDELVRDIVGCANGVYLWLRWALQDLWTALDQKQDAAYLRRRLDVLPQEVDDFFREILKSIPRQDRREAWSIFAVVKQCHAFSDPLQPTVLECSYLGELENMGRGFWRCPEDSARRIQELQRMDSFRERIKTLCRDLVQVNDAGSTDIDDTLGFTHRAIAELFDQDNLLMVGDQAMHRFFQAFDLPTRLIQLSMLLVSEVDNWFKLRVALRAVPGRCLHAIDILKQGHQPHHFEQLCVLERTVQAQQLRFYPDIVSETNLQGYFHGFARQGLFSVLAMACGQDFLEFVKWHPDTCTPHNDMQEERTKTAMLLRYMIEHGAHRNAANTLHYLLRDAGFNPNSPLEGWRWCSPWQDFVYSHLMLGESYKRNDSWPAIWQASWRTALVFLECDADPDILFRIEKGAVDSDSDGMFPDDDTPTLHGIFRKEEGAHDAQLGQMSRPSGPHIRYGNGTPAQRVSVLEKVRAAKHCPPGAIISFRDYVEYCKPPDMERILRLIDRNLKSRSDRSSVRELLARSDEHKARSKAVVAQTTSATADTPDPEASQSVEGIKTEITVPHAAAEEKPAVQFGNCLLSWRGVSLSSGRKAWLLLFLTGCLAAWLIAALYRVG